MAQYSNAFALQILSFTLYEVIHNLTPLVTALLAFFLLKEILNSIDFSLLLISFTGAMIYVYNSDLH